MHRSVGRPEHAHDEADEVSERKQREDDGEARDEGQGGNERERHQHEGCDRQHRHEQCARVGCPILGTRDECAGSKAQQQVARPAEQPIEGEGRVRGRVQEIEHRPYHEVDRQQRRHLVEAHHEARWPAALQQRELEAAGQIADEAAEEPGRSGRGGRL